MFPYRQIVEEDVMLRTKSETFSDLLHIRPDIIAVDESGTVRRRYNPGENRHDRRLTSTVMTQQYGDFVIEHIERDILQHQFLLAEFLLQTEDANSDFRSFRFRFVVIRFFDEIGGKSTKI